LNYREKVRCEEKGTRKKVKGTKRLKAQGIRCREKAGIKITAKNLKS
jgi:hypothetical protein